MMPRSFALPKPTKKAHQGLKKKVTSKASPAKGNKLVTDYFPIRRSGRITTKQVKEKEANDIQQKILSDCEDGLKIQFFEGKGRGVVATEVFPKGSFIVEYAGDLIDKSEAKLREARYGLDPGVGCYIYYFKHADKQFGIDATAESGRLGRLINHSRTKFNAVMKSVDLEIEPGYPRLYLVASREIQAGEEILYDYGDRDKSAFLAFPWLAD